MKFTIFIGSEVQSLYTSRSSRTIMMYNDLFLAGVVRVATTD